MNWGQRSCRIGYIPDGPPLLQVVVDTEEEFDWSKPFDRANTSVRSLEAQFLAQEIFDAYGIKPTYVIDYPVATSNRGLSILKEFHAKGRCLIGTHLHPWVNAPHEEEVSSPNSYPGNLEPSLERRKLRALTDAIEGGIGERPVIYKAGRYGIGPNTPQLLAEMGYLVDLSVVPHTDFGSDGGPDFRGWPDRPFWFGPKEGLFEIPLTRGFCGLAAARGAKLYDAVETGIGRTLRLGGIWSRSGFLERITLTPEGVDLAAQMRLVKVLRSRGHRVFNLSYHSPSLAPGNTPYVKNSLQLQNFLEVLKRFAEFFLGEFGGKPTTPLEVRALALSNAVPIGAL